MVARPKIIEKTIDGNGQTAKKHSMVIVPQKTLKISNGPFKTIEIFNGFLNTLNLSMVSSNQLNPHCSLKRMEHSCGHNKPFSILIMLFCSKSLTCHCQLSVYSFNEYIIHCHALQSHYEPPLLTSKPSLTIALKISKTIEKTLKPMDGTSKNIQW